MACPAFSTFGAGALRELSFWGSDEYGGITLIEEEQ
jgi:hypothetical protein